MRYRSLIATLIVTIVAAPKLHAQRPTISATVRAYTAVDTPIVALTHAKVIDGTGAAARNNQTIVIRDGRIIALGRSSSVAIPAGAQGDDLTGKSVISGPGVVHEHLFYPTRPGGDGHVAQRLTRAYLAGGVV